jgi:serine/threonine protein kinase
MREVIGYANLFDFYDIKKTIAKGTYGLVNLATHKTNGDDVAIKAIKKKDMKPADIYQ